MCKKAIIIIFCFIHLYSCSEYRGENVSTEYISNLKKELANAHVDKAEWANSPETIAQHFFPKITEDSNVDLYRYEKRVHSKKRCLMIITQNTPIDDELIGERYFIRFKMKEDLWKITDVKKEVIRRL